MSLPEKLRLLVWLAPAWFRQRCLALLPALLRSALELPQRIWIRPELGVSHLAWFRLALLAWRLSALREQLAVPVWFQPPV